MATVVDALTVTLGLDSSQFRRGREAVEGELGKTKSAAISTGKEMEAAGKNAAQFFAAVKTEALGIIGLLVGSAGLGAFVKDTTQNLAALGRAATNIGVGARDLSAFQMMIERNGGSAEAATSSLLGYANAIERFKVFGDTSILGFLNPIGASVSDDPLAVVTKFQKYIEENINKPGGAQLINLEGHGLGYDQGLINSLIQVRTLANEQRELGRSFELGVPTREQIRRAQELQSSWGGLSQAATNLGRTIESDLEPEMKATLDWVTQLVEKEPGVALGLAAISGYLVTIAGLNFGSVVAFLGRLFPLAAPLALSGDTDPNAPKTSQLPTYWQQGGGFEQMIRGWFGGGGGLNGSALTPDVEAEVRGQAALHGLDPEHMVRLAREEGGGYAKVSPAGAFGPMQLMPGTAASVGVRQGGPWQDNVRGGTAYYAMLLRQFGGNYALADAAYNAGPNNPGVQRFAKTGDMFGLPRETQKYVADINRAVGPRVGASGGNSTSVVMNGDVHVHTQATDAAGIARDAKQAIIDSWMVQGNRGLN